MSVDNVNIKKCIGCGECIATCPMDVLRMDKDTKKAKIKYQEDCQVCHLCRFYCPVDAISISPVKCFSPLVGWG